MSDNNGIGKKDEYPILKSVFQHKDQKPLQVNLDQIKKECFVLIGELQPVLGTKYQSDLLNFSNIVMDCEDFDNLSTNLKNIIALTKDFINHDQSEKQEASKLLKNIMRKLLTLEQELTASFDTEDGNYEKDFVFTNNLKAKITDVSETTQKIKTFEDLKSFIDTNFKQILTTLEKKIIETGQRIANSRIEHERINKNFSDMIVRIREKDKLLEEQSREDPLTGVFNRRVFEERITTELDRFTRYNNPFSLIFIDIDNFKYINDTYSHETGDKVLKAIATRISEMIRKPDVLARYGGEEFVVILPNTNIKQGCIVASKIREGIEDTIFEYKNAKVPVTISSGVTEVKETDTEYQSIVNRADNYMYKAKKNGRNLVVSDLDETTYK